MADIIPVIQQQIGKTKISYTSSYRTKANISKILSYLKSDRIPDLPKYGASTSMGIVEIDENNFYRKTKSPLPPINSVVKYLVPFDEIVVIHDIAHDEDTIISVCKNPIELQGKFNFTENVTIVIDEEDPDYIIFTREAIISNKSAKIPLVGHNFIHFNDYFNNQTHDFYYAILCDSQ